MSQIHVLKWGKLSKHKWSKDALEWWSVRKMTGEIIERLDEKLIKYFVGVYIT